MAEVLKGAAAAAVKQRSAKANAKVKGDAGSNAGDAKRAAEDLAILHPDGVIKLRKRTLTVREYGYIEGLQLQPGIRLFLDALYQVFSKAANAPPTAAQLRQVIVGHAVTLQWLMAQSITPYPEDATGLQQFAEDIRSNAAWVASLNDIEGDALQSVWWGVNAGFFIRRFQERLLAEREAASPSIPDGSTQT